MVLIQENMPSTNLQQWANSRRLGRPNRMTADVVITDLPL
jgi:hypothetical protein